MVSVYLWILFIICWIIGILMLFVSAKTLVDDSNDGSISYIINISSFFVSIIPFIGHSIINNDHIFFICWYILLGIVLLYHFFVLIFNAKKSFHYVVSFIITSFFIITPIIYKTDIVLCDYNDYILSAFSINVPKVLLSFWLPLFIIVLFVAFILKRKETHYINLDSDKKKENHNNVATSLEASLMLRSFENLSMKITKQSHEIMNSFQEMSRELSMMNIQKGGTNNYHLDKIMLEVFEKLENNISTLNSKLGTIDFNNQNIANPILIKEITHFIATPLATIESTCDLIQTLLSDKNKDKNRLNQYLSRIKSSVSICKGILSTYREIFLSTTSTDSTSLSTIISESFNVYKGSKNVKLKIDVKEKYDGIGNYYILSTILPILANAVRASKENTEIEVLELDGVISISNTYAEDIDISNLEKDGFSTNEGHRGMGLYTVRHLLSSRNGMNLKVYKKEDRIVFEIPIIKNNNDER